MLFRVTVAVYCENNTEHTHTLWAEYRGALEHRTFMKLSVSLQFLNPKTVGLSGLAGCRDRRFEFYSRHGCVVYVYSVFVLSCVDEVLRRADHSSKESYGLS
jgi:hypothetical protein